MKQQGYTLIEVVIAMAVSILVIGALTFATTSSLRNADIAKRQSQATKLAQEGLEKIRSIRDRDEAINSSFGGVTTFSGLWNISMSADVANCPGGICYFRFLDITGVLQQGNQLIVESLGNGAFKRQIQIIDKLTCDSVVNTCYQEEKEISSIVKWSDFAGDHQSKLTTILRRI